MLGLTVNHLAKSFHRPLFTGFTLGLEGPQVIGLIGDNGSGKSTLLKILAGIDSPDSGTVKWSEEVNLGYLPQEIESLAALSGGQRSRVQLAKFLILNPEVLLLDEPTNHLDIQSVEVLEKFLLEYEGAFVLISHDRSLVSNVASKIYTIEDEKLIEVT